MARETAIKNEGLSCDVTENKRASWTKSVIPCDRIENKYSWLPLSDLTENKRETPKTNLVKLRFSVKIALLPLTYRKY